MAAAEAGHPALSVAAVEMTFGVAVLFAAIHYLAPRLRVVFAADRPWIASAAGGMAVAFAIVVLLPELEVVHASVGEAMYLVILTGLVLFYAIELGLVRRQQGAAEAEGAARRHAALHIAIGWLYSWGLIFAMPEQATEHGAIVLLTALAVGLHLAYKDYLMSRHHDAVYLGWGRLALATAPLVAWAMAVAMPPSEMAADLVLALVAGYLLQHVFRNELPAEHLSSPASFAAGAALFGLPLAALAQLR